MNKKAEVVLKSLTAPAVRVLKIEEKVAIDQMLRLSLNVYDDQSQTVVNVDAESAMYLTCGEARALAHALLQACKEARCI